LLMFCALSKNIVFRKKLLWNHTKEEVGIRTLQFKNSMNFIK
jgi:hypothetical protein